MKKLVLVSIQLILINIVIAQSKKEQIQILTFRIDSINSILSSERNTNSQKEQGYTYKISNLENQVFSLKTDIDLFKKNIVQKDLDINKLLSEFDLKSIEVLDVKKKLKNKSDSLNIISSELNKLKASMQTKSDNVQTINKVICSDKELKIKNSNDPVLISTCLYKNYKTISKGYPDNFGRYSYEYSIFKKQENGNYIQIKNTDLFNNYKDELLRLINYKIEKDYNQFSNDPETKDCFTISTFNSFNFDQLQISFDDNKINFGCYFGLGGACRSVDGTSVSFTFEELGKYLND